MKKSEMTFSVGSFLLYVTKRKAVTKSHQPQISTLTLDKIYIDNKAGEWKAFWPIHKFLSPHNASLRPDDRWILRWMAVRKTSSFPQTWIFFFALVMAV